MAKHSQKSFAFDLQLAINDNNLHNIQSIVYKNQMDLNSVVFIGNTSPLSFAIYKRLTNCVKLLLNVGSDPNRLSTDSLGRIETPLCSAVRLGDSTILKLLLNTPGIDVNKTDFFGQTPVWLAVRERRPDFVDLIINHKNFYIDSKSFLNNNSNPLYLSAKYVNQGRVECFKALLNIGFKTNQQIIDFVLKNKNHLLIEMIERSNGKVISRQTDVDRYPVLSLLDLCRVVIRNSYLENTKNAINFHNFLKCFPLLPKKLNKFLIDLSLKT